ncbi:MAG: AAA family ATPase [Nitrosomonadaceae bacterium]
MKLLSIKIKNFRSIDDLSLDVNPLTDGSFTYGLIGINEAGKTSILQALAIKEGVIVPTSRDFKEKSKNIEILFFYQLNNADIGLFGDLLDIKNTVPGSSLSISDMLGHVVTLSVSFSVANPTVPIQKIIFTNKNTNGNTEAGLLKEKLTSFIMNEVHHSVLWTAEDRFLISHPISLDEFAAAPEQISIPLKNCFSLAGITNIQESITNIRGDSTEIEHLQNILGENVTAHIKTVWPDHPITITFLISDGAFHFHVKDVDSVSKAKTVDQRSAGFKLFISFLLTVSAQDKNEELSNTILLLDEPETHLHPLAQEHLLGELIKITKNNRNNFVFFATHSNYMIDKKDLSRNIRIIKSHDRTIKKQLAKRSSTYASVTYNVFNIPSTDYHDELYARLHQNFQDDAPNHKNREFVKTFDEEYLQRIKNLPNDRPWKQYPNSATLPTHIHNCIHNPDNKETFSAEELRESIDCLLSFLKT